MLSRFITLLELEKPQYMLWVPVIIAIGIVYYFSLTTEPSWQKSGLLALGCWVLVISIKNWGKNYFPMRWWRVILIPTLMISGFTLAAYHAHILYSPIIQPNLGTIWLRGTIEHLEPQTSGYRLYLKHLDLWQPERKNFPASETPERIRLTVRTPLNGAQPNDKIGVKVLLSPPEPFPAISGGYDFAKTAYFERIGAVGFSVSPIQVRQHGENTKIATIRHHLATRMQQSFPDAPLHASIAQALLIGERGGIPKDVLDAVYASGLGHLLSISGLHLALVMAGCFFCVRAIMACIPSLTLRYPIKKIAAWIALILGFLYLLIAGVPIPAQRAYMMAGLVFLGILLDRTGTSLRSVAIAALIVMIIQPEAVLTPSFQMSFAAVIALIAGFGSLRLFNKSSLTQHSWHRRIGYYIAGIIFSSILAGFATSPIAAYHFGRYSQYGLLANMLAIPLTSFWVMPWGVFGLLLMPFGLEEWAFIPMGWGIAGLVWISQWIAQMEGAVSLLPAMPEWTLWLFMIGGCWLAFWKTRLRHLGTPIIIIALMGMFFPPPTADILVNEKGTLFAVKDNNGQWVFNSFTKARYTRNQWLQTMAQKKPIHARDSTTLMCDEEACHYHHADKQSVFLLDELAIQHHCRPNITLLVNLQGNQRCEHASRTITHHDLEHYGTHSIWLDDPLHIQRSGEKALHRIWTRRE